MRPGYLSIYKIQRRPGNIGDTEDDRFEELEVGYIPELMKYSSRFPYLRYPSRLMPPLRDPMTFNVLLM